MKFIRILPIIILFLILSTKNSFSEFRNQSRNLIKKSYDFEKKILDELDFTEV